MTEHFLCKAILHSHMIIFFSPSFYHWCMARDMAKQNEYKSEKSTTKIHRDLVDNLVLDILASLISNLITHLHVFICVVKKRRSFCRTMVLAVNVNIILIIWARNGESSFSNWLRKNNDCIVKITSFGFGCCWRCPKTTKYSPHTEVYFLMESCFHPKCTNTYDHCWENWQHRLRDNKNHDLFFAQQTNENNCQTNTFVWNAVCHACYEIHATHFPRSDFKHPLEMSIYALMLMGSYSLCSNVDLFVWAFWALWWNRFNGGWCVCCIRKCAKRKDSWNWLWISN